MQEALESVLSQTYPAIELIIVDDGSTDGSKEIIGDFVETHDVPFVDIDEPVGNCTAFNRGWRQSSGDYLIDLAADDILLPDRVGIGIERLEETGYGVHFSDAELIDKDGEFLSNHNDRFNDLIPEGDLYKDLVSRYLICPPTMMIRNEVMKRLDGYDEKLAFEDFDFWVRSAREFKYCYTNKVLVKKRMLVNSHSSSQKRFRNEHQKSILKVCWKILEMNKTKEEGNALKRRCWHEIRQCIKKGNLGLVPGYLSVIKQC